MKLKKLLRYFHYDHKIYLKIYRNKIGEICPIYDVTSETYKNLPDWALNSYVLTIDKGDYIGADFAIKCRDTKKQGGLE